MEDFIIPLSAVTPADAGRVGPKAANLAALAHAGLPTPGGFCLSADAYRAQITALGLDDTVRRPAGRAPERGAVPVERAGQRPGPRERGGVAVQVRGGEGARPAGAPEDRAERGEVPRAELPFGEERELEVGDVAAAPALRTVPAIVALPPHSIVRGAGRAATKNSAPTSASTHSPVKSTG